jgi:hypothetical protein
MYEEKWAEYRRLRNLTIGLMLIGLPLLESASKLDSRFFKNHDTLLTISAIGWGIASFYYGFRYLYFKCPKCGAVWSSSRLKMFATNCPGCAHGKFSTRR